MCGKFYNSISEKSEKVRHRLLDLKGNIIHRGPGGIITVAGSKKKIPAQFSRPWQARIPAVNPTKCPFHKAEERAQALLVADDRDGEAWYVLDSAFAPEKPYHRLIIPDSCWEEETMRHLGGREKIHHGFILAAQRFQMEEERDKLWCFSIQVGPLAAQNVPHCHYHLYRPHFYNPDLSLMEDPPPTVNDLSETLRLALAHNHWNVIQVIPGGHYTGQLYFLPTDGGLPFNLHGAVVLAGVMHDVVRTYCTKFRSVEGLAPDYRFEFEIYRGNVVSGFFIPKLNNTGTLEDAAMVDRRRGWNLLWSHEETAAYLGDLSA